ncbi:DUF4142 domain-containing protein [Cryptosporangium aurantiacum]|uniref:Predicted outer membrane protein n=1 Tax=Cryptosporangium aurantiacum TaxID=134849 RepID=A0A1M7RIG0_9ACTN|nr:DUF4142 domain-containing protein [Cryptosporangium aurantiacum]SHN46105.1 Predicted outer membrane protein [Cryptosporangium aurantiacum]
MNTSHQRLRRPALAALLALLAAAAVATSVATSAGAADRSLNAQDRLFLRAAHQGHLAEITGARIALHQATVPVVRDLATRWIADHTTLDRALTQAAVPLDVELPAGPNADQEELAARYRETSGPEFDRLWVTTQITAHHQAEALVNAELTAGSSAAVKALARAAEPVVAAHHQLLTAAAPGVGTVIIASPNVPPPGSVPTTPSSAPPPGWRVQSPTTAPRGWTNPGFDGTTLSPIPIPGGPGPSLTVGP